jgi:hypothetical protein
VLEHELQIFNYFIERVIEKIRAATEVRVPQGGLVLKGGAASQSGDSDRLKSPEPPPATQTDIRQKRCAKLDQRS